MALSLARKTDQNGVRSSEGAGTTTLTVADNKRQRFNLSAARNVALPSAGIKAGDEFVLINPNTFTLTIKASDSSNIIKSYGSKVIVIALQDTPTASSHWEVSEHAIIYGRNWTTYTPTFVGFGTPSNVYFEWRRVGDSIDIRGYFTSGTTTGVLPTMTLPASLNLNTTKIHDIETGINGLVANLGNWGRLDSITGIYSNSRKAGWMSAFTSSTGTDKMFFAVDSATTTFNNTNANSFFNATDKATILCTSIPIQEFSEV